MEQATRRSSETLPHLVFVHGFLDSSASWSPLIESIEREGFTCSALDLRGAGKLQASTGPFTLTRSRQDVVDFVSRIEGKIALIGHSMGAQLAELAAVELAERVTALVLLTPTPLGGNTLPDEVRNLLRESGGDASAQAGIRKAFSKNLRDSDLDELVKSAVLMGKEATQGYYNAFTKGDPAGELPSTVTVPILIVAADQDPVISPDMIRAIHEERFPAATRRIISGSGHWPQIERPVETAEAVSSFILAACRVSSAD